MRSILCILYIIFHRIYSIIFMVKYAFLKNLVQKKNSLVMPINGFKV